LVKCISSFTNIKHRETEVVVDEQVKNIDNNQTNGTMETQNTKDSVL